MTRRHGNSDSPINNLSMKLLSKSFFRSIFRTYETSPVNLSAPEFPELVPVSYYHILVALQSTAYISDPKINSHKAVELVRIKMTTK